MLREWIETEYAPRNGQEVQAALRIKLYRCAPEKIVTLRPLR